MDSQTKREVDVKQSWEDYEKAAEKGPLEVFFKGLLPFVLIIAALGAVLGGLGMIFGWCGETARVGQQEFGPKAMLEKYSWFKDAAAQLEKKKADVEVYEGRVRRMEETYRETPRTQWPREDREQYNVWQSEVAGVKASYNTLAAEYNANMAKFNWRFANQGELPPGADAPLPREFKPYVTK